MSIKTGQFIKLYKIIFILIKAFLEHSRTVIVGIFSEKS